MKLTSSLLLIIAVVQATSSISLADSNITQSNDLDSGRSQVEVPVKKSAVASMKEFLNFDGKGRIYKGVGRHKEIETAKECLVYIGNVRTNRYSQVFHARVLYTKYDDRYFWFEGANASQTTGNRFEITTMDSNPDGIGFSAVYGSVILDKNADGTLKSFYSRSRHLWSTFWVNCENLTPATVEDYQRISQDTDDMIL